MDLLEERKQRLHTLIDLARVTRGWSRAQIAAVLGRDPTKIYPETGNPKMDFLVSLADALEWPVGNVIEVVWGEAPCPAPESARNGDSFTDLNKALIEAHRVGAYDRVIATARRMYEVSADAEQRAHSLAREAFAWDALGRYPKVIETLREALQLAPVSSRLRRILQANLAAAQYALWDLAPALGAAEYLTHWYEANPPESVVDQKRPAFVHYLRGNIHRRLMAVEPEGFAHHADLAERDLLIAIEQHERLADVLGDHTLLGIANACKGGVMEIRVEKGQADAVLTVSQMLDAVEEAAANPTLTGYTLEGWGWWCIFGSNIALRHLTGSHLQQAVNAFTQHAINFADRLDHWAMRERAFTLQLALHERIKASTGIEVPLRINEDHKPLIASTMGRFPQFRRAGWQILELSNLVREPAKSRSDSRGQ